jgi:hypothetical protein
MNSFRKRKSLRNRPDRGGAIADQSNDDGGSVDSELSDAAGSMADFAAKDRARRLPAIQKRDRNAAAVRKYFNDRE